MNSMAKLKLSSRYLVLLGCSFLVLLILVKHHFFASPAPEPKNVVMIFVDTLRADRMSLYGYERETSPHIAEFAKTAATFERAYSPSSWTRTSFASYFTGLYPSVHGCENREDTLSESHRTLAERFKSKGFETFGIYANRNIAASFGFDRGFDVYEHPPRNASYPGDYEITDAAEMNRRLLRWLDHERPSGPWFLFALYVDPHDPYLPHEEFQFGVPPRPRVNGSRRFLNRFRRARPGPRTDAARDYIRDLYDGEIAYVDAHVGAFLDALDRAGLAEDTVIIFSSDHGEGLWDHGFRSHGEQVFEEQIRVPLVVRWPGRTKPGQGVATAVGVIDVFGALAENFDLAAPDEYQAHSILDVLDEPAPTRPVIVEERLGEFAYRVLIDWPLKIIRDDLENTTTVFDLVLDPFEESELTFQHVSERDRMESALEGATALNREWRKRLDPRIRPARPTEEEERELRALGYVK